MANPVTFLKIPFTDHDNIMWLRHAVLYDGYKNSLVAWTLSSEWATAPTNNGLRGYQQSYDGYAHCNECNGVIDGH